MSQDSKENGNHSKAIYDRAVEVITGGVSRNTIFRKPHPFYVASASGSFIKDVEGVDRLDFANNMASLIHGHSHPAIINAVIIIFKIKKFICSDASSCI